MHPYLQQRVRRVQLGPILVGVNRAALHAIQDGRRTPCRSRAPVSALAVSRGRAAPIPRCHALSARRALTWASRAAASASGAQQGSLELCVGRRRWSRAARTARWASSRFSVRACASPVPQDKSITTRTRHRRAASVRLARLQSVAPLNARCVARAEPTQT